MRLKKGDKVGLIACSNGLSPEEEERIAQLHTCLTEMGLQPVYSKSFCYRGAFSLSAKERAESLTQLFLNDHIQAIFDVSGGDLSNQILKYLDWHIIRSHPKLFFGYSDLTVLINALYHRAGFPCVLWQVKNLVGEDSLEQQKWFYESLMEDKNSLFQVSCQLLQGLPLQGTVVGGNIRCLLKLAGTPYFPATEGKILFLESYSGGPAVLASLLAQLQQIGVFGQVKGILLGTFSQIEREKLSPDILSLALEAIANPHLPVAKTAQIGHGADSRALFIGGKLKINEDSACLIE